MQKPWEQGGFVSHPEKMQGDKIHVRSETFADRFSRAGLFWRSQTPWEQDHIVAAFCFELGKVEAAAIRTRMVSTRTRVDAVLARRVAGGLGMAVPAPPAGARNVTRTDKPETDPALRMANTHCASIAVPGKPANDTFVRSFVAAIAKHRFPERPDLNAMVA